MNRAGGFHRLFFIHPFARGLPCRSVRASCSINNSLPPNAVNAFTVHDVWHTGGTDVPHKLDAHHMTTIHLAPFEVLTLELTPTAAEHSPRMEPL